MIVLDAGASVGKFAAPLYTQAEASRFLGLSESTVRNWARGYHGTAGGRNVIGEPILSTVSSPVIAARTSLLLVWPRGTP